MPASKVKKSTGNPADRFHGPGPGRPKGSPNKTTALLKDAILKAAEAAGGDAGMVGYLTGQATANPQAFLPLLGKVLPLQVAGDPDSPLEIFVTIGGNAPSS